MFLTWFSFSLDLAFGSPEVIILKDYQNTGAPSPMPPDAHIVASINQALVLNIGDISLKLNTNQNFGMIQSGNAKLEFGNFSLLSYARDPCIHMTDIPKSFLESNNI